MSFPADEAGRMQKLASRVLGTNEPDVTVERSTLSKSIRPESLLARMHSLRVTTGTVIAELEGEVA